MEEGEECLKIRYGLEMPHFMTWIYNSGDSFIDISPKGPSVITLFINQTLTLNYMNTLPHYS